MEENKKIFDFRNNGKKKERGREKNESYQLGIPELQNDYDYIYYEKRAFQP